MSRRKKSEEEKAKPVPISFKHQHLVMLTELTRCFKKNRSRILQKLVEDAYYIYLQGNEHGNTNL